MHDIKMSEITCQKCGSRYRLSFTKVIFRDKDTIECLVCGEELHRWNEAKIWHAELLEKHTNHEAP